MKLLLLAIPYFLKIIDKYLDKNEQDQKLKDDWMKFIFSMNHAGNKSKKMQTELNKIITRQYKEDSSKRRTPEN